MSVDALIDAKISKTYSRRAFVKDAISGIGTIAIGTFTVQFLASCTSSSPTGPSNNDGVELIVDLSLSDNQALRVVGGTLALSSNNLDDSGLLLIRQNQSTIRVFSRECTHNQCTIDAFSNGKSVCPCHGSQYNTSGAVIKGPASNSLKEYDVTFDNNIITIT